jgi:hypothetical protein
MHPRRSKAYIHYKSRRGKKCKASPKGWSFCCYKLRLGQCLLLSRRAWRQLARTCKQGANPQMDRGYMLASVALKTRVQLHAGICPCLSNSISIHRICNLQQRAGCAESFTRPPANCLGTRTTGPKIPDFCHRWRLKSSPTAPWSMHMIG